MRSLRRPSRTPSRTTLSAGPVVLRGVVGLPTGAPGGVAAGPLDVPGGEAQFDLRTTDAGLIIARSDWFRLEVPSLVLWSIVSGVVTGPVAGLADGPNTHVLELTVSDDAWAADHSSFRFLVPTSDVGPLLRAVAAGRESAIPAVASAGPDDVPAAVGAVSGAVGAAATGAAGSGAAGATDAVGGMAAAASHWLGDRRKTADPRHGLGRRRIGPAAVALVALILLAGSTSSSFGSFAGGASRHRGAPARGNGAQAAETHPVVDLPAATATPAPAPPSLAASPALQPHEIFGYAPYWTLPQSAGFDVKDLTTLAYFSVDANGDGTLDESGSGWNGYESQDLANLVTRSHAAGDRVVLTVTCFSQAALDAITSDPNAGARLSAALVAAVSAKNLDGVNFDFEGEGSGDRRGLTALITQVSSALHAADSHWQVTMATYASAAGDSAGFYDVAALAPALDGFFVMAYDMNDRVTPSATAPLTGGGFNDTQALQQFTAVMPPQKVILGVPFYGYDWPTTDGTRTAQPTGGESPLSDGVIAASGHPTYWDPATQTPWTSYQVGSQWHETFFDDPTSLALKAQLANAFHIGGMGIWALGMDGNDPAMLAALLGNAPAVKNYQTGPTPSAAGTPPGTPPGSGFVTTGVWNGTTVPLSPVVPPTAYGDAQYLGTLSGVQTTAPALACLQSGPPLEVWSIAALPGVDVAVAAQPGNCVTGMWTFPPPATSGGPGAGATTTTFPPTTLPPTSTTTTGVPPTSTTTSVPSTTTTGQATTTTLGH